MEPKLTIADKLIFGYERPDPTRLGLVEEGLLGSNSLLIPQGTVEVRLHLVNRAHYTPLEEVSYKASNLPLDIALGLAGEILEELYAPIRDYIEAEVLGGYVGKELEHKDPALYWRLRRDLLPVLYAAHNDCQRIREQLRGVEDFVSQPTATPTSKEG